MRVEHGTGFGEVESLNLLQHGDHLAQQILSFPVQGCVFVHELLVADRDGDRYFPGAVVLLDAVEHGQHGDKA
ncbi:hypothetical protein D3C80_2077190 [compost metagenome]